MKNEKSAEKVAIENDFNIATRKKTNQANVKLDKLQDFEDHPYKVQDDEAMEELKASIKEFGLLNRILVRPLNGDDGKYEIISGHRRVHAAKALGLKELPAIIYPIDHDEATLLMVDSNNQRTDISPMEKGRAYRMKYEAMKHQGKSTSDQVGPKLTVEEISDKDSPSQVKRFMRLTYLIPELQERVDSGQMKVSPAVEVSYLDEDCQREVAEYFKMNEVSPSHSQAIRMHKEYDADTLDRERVIAILDEIKPNQVDKLKIPMEDIRRYFPKDYTPQQMSEKIKKLLEENSRKERNRSEDRSI